MRPKTLGQIQFLVLSFSCLPLPRGTHLHSPLCSHEGFKHLEGNTGPGAARLLNPTFRNEGESQNRSLLLKNSIPPRSKSSWDFLLDCFSPRMSPKCSGASPSARADKRPPVQVIPRLRDSVLSVCPHILSAVSCRLCEAELRPPLTTCPDRKVFPVRRQAWPCVQVALPTTGCRSCDAPPWRAHRAAFCATRRTPALLPRPDAK